MASTKRTWVWIILGIVGTLFLFFIAVIGTAVYMFRTHVTNEVVAAAAAEQTFNQQREKFKGQQPLVELFANELDDENATVHRPPASASRAKINTLRVLIHDRVDNHLIHVDIPGWVVRMMPRDIIGGFN